MSATLASPASVHVDETLATAVRQGLASAPKWLPAWLFYDQAGSKLFEAITERPEYYLTRTERGILAAHAAEIIARASAYASERTQLRIAGPQASTHTL